MRTFTKPLLVTTSLLFLFAFLFILTKTPVKADPSSNPIFATIQHVDNAISTSLSPIQKAIADLQTQQANQASQISSLQTALPGGLKVYDAKGQEVGIMIDHAGADDILYSPAIQSPVDVEAHDKLKPPDTFDR